MVNKIKMLFSVSIAGSLLCLVGDMFLGCFYPSEKTGVFYLFPAFSDEWKNAAAMRFPLGALLGVIALFMMFCGLYAIFILLKEKESKYAKAFLLSSIGFLAVGTVYHCLFAISAWLYNQLAPVDIILAKQTSEHLFTTFLPVASSAAISFILLSIIMFIIALKGTWGSKCWIIINPILWMGLFMLIAAILPSNSIINGLFDWGQQSLGFFVVFLAFSFSKQ